MIYIYFLSLSLPPSLSLFLSLSISGALFIFNLLKDSIISIQSLSVLNELLCTAVFLHRELKFKKCLLRNLKETGRCFKLSTCQGLLMIEIIRLPVRGSIKKKRKKFCTTIYLLMDEPLLLILARSPQADENYLQLTPVHVIGPGAQFQTRETRVSSIFGIQVPNGQIQPMGLYHVAYREFF